MGCPYCAMQNQGCLFSVMILKVSFFLKTELIIAVRVHDRAIQVYIELVIIF